MHTKEVQGHLVVVLYKHYIPFVVTFLPMRLRERAKEEFFSLSSFKNRGKQRTQSWTLRLVCLSSTHTVLVVFHVQWLLKKLWLKLDLEKKKFWFLMSHVLRRNSGMWSYLTFLSWKTVVDLNFLDAFQIQKSLILYHWTSPNLLNC